MSQDRKIAVMPVWDEHVVPQRDGASPAGDQNDLSQQP
jgi:hypothetical protein